MGLFDSLKEIFSDAPEWKGARFEKYVLNLFNPKYYALVEKTPGFQNMDDDYFRSRGSDIRDISERVDVPANGFSSTLLSS